MFLDVAPYDKVVLVGIDADVRIIFFAASITCMISDMSAGFASLMVLLIIY